MPSRRTHSKSRHGCAGCKVRKVKCDEARPSCARCIRRADICHYKDTLISTSTATSRYSTPSTVNSPEPPTDFLINTFSFAPSTPQSGQQRNDQDPELLHHYSTSTYRTLASSSSLEQLWQITVPQMAFSNPFLMHGLLSMSACHLAHLRPVVAGHYNILAIHHHTSAISLFRPLLDNIDSENAIPLIAFSTLVACLSFAMPQVSLHRLAPPSTGISFVKHVLDVFRLMRGVRGVMESAWVWVKGSAVAPLLTLSVEKLEEPLEFAAEVAVRALEARIHVDAESEDEKTDYLDAMNHFRTCYPRGPLGTHHQALIFAWPVLVSDRFFTTMNERKTIPIAILGFYGTLLHMLSHIWWAGDKGSRLVKTVSELLPPEWESVMKWARMRVDLQGFVRQEF